MSAVATGRKACLCPAGPECTIIRQPSGAPAHRKKWARLMATAIEQVRSNPEAFPEGHPIRTRLEAAGAL